MRYTMYHAGIQRQSPMSSRVSSRQCYCAGTADAGLLACPCANGRRQRIGKPAETRSAPQRGGTNVVGQLNAQDASFQGSVLGWEIHQTVLGRAGPEGQYSLFQEKLSGKQAEGWLTKQEYHAKQRAFERQYLRWELSSSARRGTHASRTAARDANLRDSMRTIHSRRLRTLSRRR